MSSFRRTRALLGGFQILWVGGSLLYFGWVVFGPPWFFPERRPAEWIGADLAIDLFLLFSFVFLHSLLIRERAREVLEHLIAPDYYRFVYASFSALHLYLIALFWRPVGVWVYRPPLPLQFLALSLLGVIGFILVAFSRGLKTEELLGLPRPAGNRRPQTRLQIVGLFRVVRHPIYALTIPALWLVPVYTIERILMAFIFSLYFILGSRLEERDLIRRFPEYADYQRRVPAFIPPLRRAGELSESKK